MLGYRFLRRHKARPLIARPSIEDALFRAGSLVVILSLLHIRLAAAGVGTAIAYEAADGKVRVNPPFGETVQARALFALVSGEPGAAQARAAAALRPA